MQRRKSDIKRDSSIDTLTGVGGEMGGRVLTMMWGDISVCPARHIIWWGANTS